MLQFGLIFSSQGRYEISEENSLDFLHPHLKIYLHPLSVIKVEGMFLLFLFRSLGLISADCPSSLSSFLPVFLPLVRVRFIEGVVCFHCPRFFPSCLYLAVFCHGQRVSGTTSLLFSLKVSVFLPFALCSICCC